MVFGGRPHSHSFRTSCQTLKYSFLPSIIATLHHIQHYFTDHSASAVYISRASNMATPEILEALLQLKKQPLDDDNGLADELANKVKNAPPGNASATGASSSVEIDKAGEGDELFCLEDELKLPVDEADDKTDVHATPKKASDLASDLVSRKRDAEAAAAGTAPRPGKFQTTPHNVSKCIPHAAPLKKHTLDRELRIKMMRGPFPSDLPAMVITNLSEYRYREPETPKLTPTAPRIPFSVARENTNTVLLFVGDEIGIRDSIFDLAYTYRKVWDFQRGAFITGWHQDTVVQYDRESGPAIRRRKDNHGEYEHTIIASPEHCGATAIRRNLRS